MISSFTETNKLQAFAHVSLFRKRNANVSYGELRLIHAVAHLFGGHLIMTSERQLRYARPLAMRVELLAAECRASRARAAILPRGACA